MKKGFILVIILAALAALFFIPFNRKEDIHVDAAFFKVYKLLLIPRDWANWHPEVKKNFDADSAKVSFITKPNGYAVTTPDVSINVRQSASTFVISQQGLNGDHNYALSAAPNRNAQKTIIGVVLRTNLAGYVAGWFSKDPFKNTGVSQLKQYLENDRLYYGYRIYKVKVPEADLLTITKVVPKAMQFAVANSSYTDLTKFITEKQLTKLQPVIAQYVPKGPDSTWVKVGFFIDKEINAKGYITYVKMPKNGPLVVIDYKGKFNERQKAYAALKRYFTDHTYQSAIMPFETYFNDKLPKTDSDRVNIRINFTSFQ